MERQKPYKRFTQELGNTINTKDKKDKKNIFNDPIGLLRIFFFFF